jgi:hypothetical protein
MNSGYFAPFIVLYQAKIDYSNSNNNIDEELIAIYRNYGLGIIFGRQWIFDNNFTLDIFGGFGGINNVVKASFKTNDPEVNFEEIEDDIRNFSETNYYSKNLEIDISENQLKGKTSFILPTLRLGFSLGYSF